MPRSDFNSLGTQLVDAGVSPKYVVRLKKELRDHLADLEAEACRASRSPAEAEVEARERLGEDRVIVSKFLEHPELKLWIYRSKWAVGTLRWCVYTAAGLLAPMFVLAAGRRTYARYCAAAGAAASVTCALLLTMEATIDGGPQTVRFVPRTADLRAAPGDRAEQAGAPASATFAAALASLEAALDLQAPSRPELRPMAKPPLPAPVLMPEPAIQLAAEPMILEQPDVAIVESRFAAAIPPAIDDAEYIPIVRTAPTYPARAVARGIEGYVVIEYTVTRLGTVNEVIVVESSSDLFEEAAIRAAYQFKYRPRVVQGETVDVTGVRSKITFRIEA